jgi:hypothetical protein
VNPATFANAEGASFGARAPLRGMQLSSLVPIEYRGERVALVSSRRAYIISPRLLAAPVGDAEDLLVVALMCACCSEVFAGNLPGPYTDEPGERWARRA